MKTQIALALSVVLGLKIATTNLKPNAIASGQSRSTSNQAPVLVNTCLITNDVKRLAAFYTQVLQMQPHQAADNYFEFRTSAGVLALFAADAQEKYIPGSATPGQNHSAILEFRVQDVDQEYSRLRELVKSWVKGPTTQPWGTRSIYFRDPDGNLVDFFTPGASGRQ